MIAYDSLRADQSTFERYQGVKQLRVWEAVALHFYLDPERLILNRRGRWSELKEIQHSLVRVIPCFLVFLTNLECALRLYQVKDTRYRLQC
jgi:hypothetical protein